MWTSFKKHLNGHKLNFIYNFIYSLIKSKKWMCFNFVQIKVIFFLIIQLFHCIIICCFISDKNFALIHKKIIFLITHHKLFEVKYLLTCAATWVISPFHVSKDKDGAAFSQPLPLIVPTAGCLVITHRYVYPHHFIVIESPW